MGCTPRRKPVMGQCVEYELGNMYDPAYTFVCKIANDTWISCARRRPKKKHRFLKRWRLYATQAQETGFLGAFVRQVSLHCQGTIESCLQLSESPRAQWGHHLRVEGNKWVYT